MGKYIVFLLFCDHIINYCDHKIKIVLRNYIIFRLLKKKHASQGVSFRIYFDIYASEASIAMQASTRPLTAFTDLSNPACSSLLSLISTTRSTPPAPMTVGTPT